MKECKICIMNDTVEEFQLLKNDTCNFCYQFTKDKKKAFTVEEIENNLNQIKEKIKNNPKKKIYDCIIGLSGGTDSSYVVYLAWKMKLNPLIIHMDNGWNSKTSNQNINRILEKTNFDFETLVLEWNEFKDLQISFLKAGVPDIELITDHAIFSYILNYSLKNEIKYIISGVNFATEHGSIPSWGWRKDDYSHIKLIHKKFGKVKLETFPRMYPFKKFIFEKIFKKVNYINLLDYINYKSTEAKKVLKKEFDWEDYGGKHHESFFTKFFQGYILPKKFNIDKRLIHLSCLIRNNEISRETAKVNLSTPYIEKEKINMYKSFFLKKLALSDNEFEKIMNLKPNKHSDYSYDFNKNWLIKYLKKKLIKK